MFKGILCVLGGVALASAIPAGLATNLHFQGVYKDRAKDMITQVQQTLDFKDTYEKEKEDLENRHSAEVGEIGYQEYTDRKEYLESDEFAVDYMSQNYQDLYEAYLKNDKQYKLTENAMVPLSILILAEAALTTSFTTATLMFGEGWERLAGLNYIVATGVESIIESIDDRKFQKEQLKQMNSWNSDEEEFFR